jgi:hypothetical protein
MSLRLIDPQTGDGAPLAAGATRITMCKCTTFEA